MKKIFNKKNISIIIVICIILPLIGDAMGVFANPLSKLFNRNTLINNSSIRILEIQPGNKFKLGGDRTEPGLNIKKKVNVNNKEYNLLIDYITMPEFIGKIEQLNGYYDAIVIGNETHIEDTTIPYRSYSQINNIGKEFSSDMNEEEKNTFPYINFVYKKPNYNYVENDITNKKANEIIEFINSGQLVYIDNSILINNNLSNSILVSKFKNIDKENFIKYNSSSDIELKSIINKYNSDTISKRPAIELIAPIGDNASDKQGDTKKRNMRFVISMPEYNKSVDIKLYLDMNGDGLFKEKECYKIEEGILIDQSYTFEYEIGSDFIGYLDWKIEIIEKENGKINQVKSYISGNIYYKTLEEGLKKRINVLQIKPDSTNGLDLSSDSKFNELIGKGNNQNINSKFDYDINVTSITVDDFNKNNIELNKNYDMIIIGFKDNYGGKDLNDKSIEKIKSFIETGQSVMFTHDTLSPDMSNKHKISTNFRDYIGQSRFKDVYRMKPDGSFDESDIYKDYDAEGQSKDKTIEHIDLGENSNKILGVSYHSRGDKKDSASIYKTNDAMITNYPYELDNEVNDQNNLPVSKTHTQYYQVNLEDPDLVPWYNLAYTKGTTNGKLNKYDSRNNYYTYSKGNITFSGTGHANGQYNEPELKLFVNTIVKAERGANHAPTIKTNIDSNESSKNNPKEISATSEFFEFTATPKDIDNDKVDINISIEKRNEDESTEWVELENKENIPQGTVVKVNIPKEYYENRVGEIIKIKVHAKDIKGAETIKEYEIKPVLDPIITYTTTDGVGLIGDTISFNVILKKENEENDEISNVSLKAINTNTNQIKELDESERKIDFNIDKISSQTYTLKTNSIFNGQVKLELKYNVKVKGDEGINEYDTIEKKDEITVNIDSKRGEIKLKTVDKVGNILPQFEGSSTLSGDNGFISKVSIFGLQGGAYSWPDISKQDITTSNYTLSLTTKTESTNFKIIGHQIKDSEGNILNSDKNTTQKIPINYNNPKVEVTFTIERDKPIDTSNNKQLKILEIQPGNKFILTRNKSKDDIIPGGREIVKISAGESGDISSYMEELIIDHISMPEFIGKLDQLNGYYDAIVIGRNTDGIKNNYKDYSQINDNSNEESSYQENDITNRKADEIIDFISKSQIVYIDKQIFSEDIKNSNLVKKFKKFNNANSNVNIYENNQALTLDNIIDKYTVNKKNQKTRPLISVESPIGDDSSHLWEEGITPNEDNDILGSIENRNLQFKVNMLQESKEGSIYSIKLYLDINGDGIYSESEEKVKTYENQQVSSNGFEIQYNLSENFIGQLNWKVELERDDGVKSYLTGKMNFRRLEGQPKREINILQIMPDNTNLNLSQEQTEFKKQLDKVKDYDINIEAISINDFNGNHGSIASNLYKYDMIILGFKSGDKNITGYPLEKLTEFVTKNEKGIIFTNDTIISNNQLTNQFKNYIGQERFNNSSIKGETIYKNTVSSEIIQQTNEGLITDYPYNLKLEDLNSKGSGQNIVQLSPSKLNIKETHTQYFQLDFEKEEVVPWYNINGSNNEFDSRNSYYTYSKDNVVFSAIGKDKDGEYGESEMKLLVNSLIKTERGSNHSPDIITTIPEKMYETYDYEIPHNEDYKFKVAADDIDDDNIKSLTVSYRVINEENDKENWVTEGKYAFTNVNKKEFKDIIIGNGVWKGNSGDISQMKNILQIKVEAIDEHDAKSEKIYTILPTDRPTLDANPQDVNGLVGDNINATIPLTYKNNDDINDNKIKNITVREIDKKYQNLFKKLNISFDKNTNTINVNVQASNIITLQQVPIIVDYEVKNGHIYDKKVLQIPININIKKGEVGLNIVTENNEPLGFVPKVTLKSSKVNSSAYVNSNYTWSIDTNTTVTTDNYYIQLNNLDDSGVEIIEYSINNEIQANETQFSINYDNPKAIVTIKLSLGKPGQITKHGIYNKKGNSYTIGLETQNVIQNMYYTMGVEFDIGKTNSVVNINLPNTATLDVNNIYLFEVSEDGILGKELQEKIITTNNKIVVSNLSKDKKYLLIYTSKFDQNSNIDGQLKYLEKTESEKDFSVQLDVIPDPEESGNNVPDIPELF